MKHRLAPTRKLSRLLGITITVALTLLGRAQAQAPVAAVSHANNDFGIRLYKQIAKEDAAKNRFMSPMSVFTALAMTSEGLGDGSRETLRKAMGLPDEATLHAGLQSLAKDLNPEDAPFALALANAIWPEKSFSLKPEFLKTIETIYGGASVPQDYKRAFEAARGNINAWVEKKTHDRIKNLLPAGSLTNLTRMVLTNAIYFKGKWETEFDKKLTQEQPFTLEDGKSVQTPLMAQHHMQRAYAEVDGVQAVQLPYKGNALSMVILLPKNGQMHKLEKGFDTERFNTITQAMRYQQVNVWLPSFKMELGGSISEQLKDMGLASLFEEADFSRMFSDNVPFAISDVFHKAFVEVNEEGTEAAAATAVVVVETTSMPSHRPIIYDFRADHPFLFFIQHNASKSILFMGKVMDPTAK